MARHGEGGAMRWELVWTALASVIVLVCLYYAFIY